MPKYLFLNQLFVCKKNGEKSFYTTFSKNVNIVCGKNTSGKSTVFQSILYTLGINDGKEKLDEIISEDVLFRLDFSILDKDLDKENKTDYIFIRDDEFLFVINNDNILRFNGISADNSAEHIKLKEYIHSILSCNFMLESKKGFVSAPIESLFLPYYVSQDFGWIYIRKSFTNLDFYKSFKEDYLDYYLGIDSQIDRKEKNDLEKRIYELQQKIEIYKKIKDTSEVQTAKINDVKEPEFIKEYISGLNKTNARVLDDEKKLLLKYNEFEYWKERNSVLSKIKRNHENQFRENSLCPVCKQMLPNNTETIYQYYQEANDTTSELNICKKNMKKIQSTINQIVKDIEDERKDAKEREIILGNRKINYSTTSEWVEEKAYIKLNDTINGNIGEITIELDELRKEKKEKYSDENIDKIRNSKGKEFREIFINKLHKLGVNRFDNTKYVNLYSINAFPAQGVELHKMMLAYYLSFNELIEIINYAHITPLLLDAIFKEDIDDDNKLLLINVLSKSMKNQKQLIVSIAETEESQYNAEYYNREYFDNNAKIVRIGESKNERSFLAANVIDNKELFEETLRYVDEN